MTLDIETYASTDEVNKGLSFPYACGFRARVGECTLFYLDEGEDPINLVVRMLTELLRSSKKAATVYVHNLAGFDSRFILDALGRMPEYKVDVLGRGATRIFSIRISIKVGSR